MKSAGARSGCNLRYGDSSISRMSQCNYWMYWKGKKSDSYPEEWVPGGAGQLFKQHKVSVTVGLIGISLNISVIQPRAGSQMLADDFSEVCVGDDGIYR